MWIFTSRLRRERGDNTTKGFSMSRTTSSLMAIAVFVGVAASATGAAAASAKPVVVYTSVDQEFAEVIFKEAEAATGLKIQVVFDAEASKTVGLERRLQAEKARPKADVFWNSEFLRTHRLAQQKVLNAPPGVDTTGIPAEFRSPGFVGTGMRARVIAVNTTLVAEPDRPRRLEDLANARWKGKVAVAKPLFGTTATHFAALHAKWGAARYTSFLQALKKNDVMLLPGNGDVRDAVAAGRAAVGLTDTDDAIGAIRRGQPLMQVFPDQESDGAFSVFMTLGQVTGAPHPEAATQLIRYLAGEKVEQRLIELGAVQIPVRTNLSMARELGTTRPKLWHLDAGKIEASLEPSIELIKKYLL